MLATVQAAALKGKRGALKGARKGGTPLAALPPKADLKQWFSPVEDQGTLGSCTAHAGVGLVEYFERRASGKHVDASRLFLYKATRNLLHWTGDTGAYLRTTMQALVCFGVPPEEYWPYNVSNYDKEPAAFLYAFGQNYKATKYYRLDPSGTSRPDVVKRIKSNLSVGLPSMFGFTVYSSIDQGETTGRIPFPANGDSVEGGHAVIAMGYDDKMKIRNMASGARETVGAFMIRNSWGKGWGDKGYGWLPYDYVLRGISEDWWSLISSEWVNTGQFGTE
jgi:C1A family cysteine protease